MFEYIIQPGDTLDVIGSHFGVTTDMLLAANPGLNPFNLIPTQIILVPVSTYLYERFPWYITFPYLFITHPWSYWNNPVFWPAGPWKRPGGWPGGPGCPGNIRKTNCLFISGLLNRFGLSVDFYVFHYPA